VFLGMPLALSSFLMIIICCFTDVLPSLALVYEKPESKLMTLPPRRLGKDHLVDWKLLLNAYLFIGMIEAGVAFLTFFVFYASHGYDPGQVLLSFGEGDGPPELQNKGQCLYFYALVVMQFGNVLTSRTSMLPIWRQNPFVGVTRNLRIFVAIPISASIVALTCYLPPIQNQLATTDLPAEWLPLTIPWAGALLLILLNETRKVCAERFPDGPIAKLSWR